MYYYGFRKFLFKVNGILSAFVVTHCEKKKKNHESMPFRNFPILYLFPTFYLWKSVSPIKEWKLCPTTFLQKTSLFFSQSPTFLVRLECVFPFAVRTGFPVLSNFYIVHSHTIIFILVMVSTPERGGTHLIWTMG